MNRQGNILDCDLRLRQDIKRKFMLCRNSPHSGRDFEVQKLNRQFCLLLQPNLMLSKLKTLQLHSNFNFYFILVILALHLVLVQLQF